MIDKKAEMKKWQDFFAEILTDFRRQFPESDQTDTEVLTEFCEFLAEKGTIKKKNGKFILGILNEGKLH